MIPDVGGGSTLSRMSSTVHYFNWLHLVFVFKTNKVFAEGWHCPEAQASPRTHAPMSVTTTVAEVLLQSWRSREGFVSLLGGDWTHSLVHARHYHWAHLHVSLCYVGSSDPPVPASWVSGTSGVCCHTPDQVVLISAIYEVEFYTGFRTILNLFLRLLC